MSECETPEQISICGFESHGEEYGGAVIVAASASAVAAAVGLQSVIIAMPPAIIWASEYFTTISLV